MKTVLTKPHSPMDLSFWASSALIRPVPLDRDENSCQSPWKTVLIRS